ncbi:MAG TPA: hypothetical protein PKE14_13730, partial [Chitinophagales bacterium]|nr:hypothetical protein [Chitinophagales bacterium]
MRNMLVIAGMCTIVSACTNNKPQTEDDVKGPGKVTYPVTATADSSSDFFGTTVADPYRWLEAEANDDPKVRQWVTDQNKVTFDYLAEIPYREQIKQRMLDLANYPKMTTPSRAGDYYYYQKNDGL